MAIILSSSHCSCGLVINCCLARHTYAAALHITHQRLKQEHNSWREGQADKQPIENRECDRAHASISAVLSCPFMVLATAEISVLPDQSHVVLYTDARTLRNG